ncbi:MAG: 2,3-bisphosphoglycerate-independent phosphoglycerate mutase [Patescibacteria group bacterium]
MDARDWVLVVILLPEVSVIMFLLNYLLEVYMSLANKVLLIILDGWGLSGKKEGNAPLLAKTPILDYVYSTYPKTSLTASGLEVGLGQGEPGNSEVGHLNIGSGRVIWENLPKIDQMIANGELYKNKALLEIIDHVKKNNSTLNFIGLVSDGGVHSHIMHLSSMIEFAAKQGIKNINIHMITDGRDTPPSIAASYAEQLEAFCRGVGAGKIVTLVGRYLAMDRDKNWDREKQAFDLFTQNIGEKYDTAKEAIDDNYAAGKTDEFIEASVIGEGGKVSENDGVIFFNHRNDRMRQLLDLFEGGEGAAVPTGLKLITMTQYFKGQKSEFILSSQNLENTLSEIVSKNGGTQFHTAETEKYAHVTYFFKAGKEEPYQGEVDEVVPSKKTTYDKLPQMSAPEVRDQVVASLKEGYNLVIVNFANGDMVGHTGVLEAAVKACEEVDRDLGLVLEGAAEHDYRVFITADHGNCEEMIALDGTTPNKEHTSNPVPFVYLNFENHPYRPTSVPFLEPDYLQYAIGTPVGVLADIAPSILANLEIPLPGEMGGMDLSVAML